MPSKFRPPGGELTWYSIIFLGLGIYIAVLRFSRSDIIAGLVAVLAAVCGVALWFKQKWTRWVLTAILVLFAGEMVFVIATKGFTWVRLACVAAISWGAWDVWRKLAPENFHPEEPKAMISLVLLLREERYLEARVLAQIVSSAWGSEYHSGDDAAEDSLQFVVGESPLFAVQSPEAFFAVHNLSFPYFDDTESVVSELRELRIVKAVQDHKAWLAVDLIAVHDPNRPPESVYPQIAKLIAELAGPDALAIFQPQTGRMTPWDDSLEAKLRGPDALSVFGFPAHPPVIRVDDDDPRMKTAVSQARERWPEFVAAFKAGDGGKFSVKAPITVGECTEFIWIDVTGLEPEYIHGTLGNHPVNLEGMKLGDRVEVPVRDLNDWIYFRDDEPVGMFTVKVLRDIERKAAGAP